MAKKKSDGTKLREKIGTGRGIDYIPWLKPHEFGSFGRVHRIYGWKINRIHYLMSDLELYYFLLIQWEDNVIDIREQFPLQLIDTVSIANNLGIKHPPKTKKSGNETVMTTDFVITIKGNNCCKDVVRTIKLNSDLKKQRVMEKLSIEKEYFRMKGIDWGIITEEQVNKIKAQNLYMLYNSFFWAKNTKTGQEELNKLTYELKNMLLKYNRDVIKVCSDFEKSKSWEKGEGLNFFKYLITKKVINIDMNIKLNFNNMKIFFCGEGQNVSITG